MHRKVWGTCCPSKSCNLSLDCPPCVVIFKMADKISMTQRFPASTPKSNEPAYISSQRYIPNNVTLKKRTVCILRPLSAYGGAPVIKMLLVAQCIWISFCFLQQKMSQNGKVTFNGDGQISKSDEGFVS